MAGGTLELCAEFSHRACHRTSRQDIEFGGLQIGRRQKREAEHRRGCGERRLLHDIPLVMAAS